MKKISSTQDALVENLKLNSHCFETFVSPQT